jgi:hypothetical protein
VAKSTTTKVAKSARRQSSERRWFGLTSKALVSESRQAEKRQIKRARRARLGLDKLIRFTKGNREQSFRPKEKAKVAVHVEWTSKGRFWVVNELRSLECGF